MRASVLALCAGLLAGGPARADPAADTTVVVDEGQTLLGIAFDMLPVSDSFTVLELAERIRTHNELASDLLAVGQALRIPLGRGAHPARSRETSPVRGFYVTASVAGSRRVLALVDSFVAAGGNAVVFDIKDRQGDLSYVSAAPLARQTQVCSLATLDEPEALVERLQRRDLRAIARLACFCDARLAAARPDLKPRQADGSPWGTDWLDPGRPEVQAYLLDLIDEVAALGVDEIQLDYVRFPTEDGASQAVFTVPDSAPRHGVITGFVGRARQRLAGSGVQLSADLFGVVAWGREVDVERTGQYLPDLVPLLDVACPMLYPSHFFSRFDGFDNPADHPYFFVHEGVRQMLPLARAHGVAVRPWIQAFPYRVTAFDEGYVAEQIRAAEDAGADGWLLWHPASRYDVGLQAVRQSVEDRARAGPDPASTQVETRHPPAAPM